MHRIVQRALRRACLPDWLFCALLLAAPAAWTADPPGAEAFGLTPRVSSVAISPGGTSLAWIDHTLAHPHIAIHDIASGKVRRVGDSDTSVQFLATRGYAVVQPQFRGSTGFGEAHRLAGYRQWGKRMQDDVSNAVNYWKDHIGSQHDEAVIAASPARAAHSVRAPVLLLHGRSDTVVPVIQSRLMEQALRNAGKTVTLVEMDGEDHYMSMSDTRVRLLRELEAFLARYL